MPSAQRRKADTVPPGAAGEKVSYPRGSRKQSTGAEKAGRVNACPPARGYTIKNPPDLSGGSKPLFGVFDRAVLAYDVDLDLPRVLQLLLDPAGDVPR